MPAIIKRKPVGAEWADESDSVMEGDMERALRKIIGAVKPMLPEGDPFDAVNPMPGASLASPLITIFKNSVARKAATEGFVKNAADRVGGTIGVAAEQFARKYPRVAAHMDLRRIGEGAPGVTGTTNFQVGKVKEPIAVDITNKGVAHTKDSLNEALKLMYEEGTHAAQNLGNSHAAGLYRNADQVVGYNANPFEVSAKGAAERAIGKKVLHRPAMRGVARVAEAPTGEVEATAALRRMLELRNVK